MPSKRKPISTKQRKEQLKLKRAVKRGDISPPPPSNTDRRTRRPRNGPTGQPVGGARAADSVRRLESSFVRLPSHFLKKTEILASTLPLTRPVPPEAAILPDVDKEVLPAAPEGPRTQVAQLTCPKRPKWRYDMSKKEVEANEEGLFKKWLAQTDPAVHAWCSPEEPSEKVTQPTTQEPEGNKEPEKMPHAPTSFERNLEVWRQLWRVTEISQILLILLDSRCPTLHFPPALATYLTGVPHASRLRTILVLTKVDISGPERAAAWTRHLNALYPAMRVVQVESYAEKPQDANESKKRTYEPQLPSAFRSALVDALRETHAEMLEPPEAVRNRPERLATWKPRIKTQVDWNAVLKAQGGQVGTAIGGATAPKPSKVVSDDHTGGEDTDDEAEPEVLTIGLIGQPNVGKSSLLNALFGTHKVKASRTPGKTKHFQTLFWTPEVRLVDCPGLVFPNFVPMETQVLSGILPISRVSAIPLCIHHAAQLLPLEKVFDLAHPSLSETPAQDKRTWRDGMRPRTTGAAEAANRDRDAVWTAMDILTAYATKKGWVTAKVGRPDVNRAGNAGACFVLVFHPHAHVAAYPCLTLLRARPPTQPSNHGRVVIVASIVAIAHIVDFGRLVVYTVLRALAEGRVPWAFWPPGTDAHTISAHQPVEGAGIWIARGQAGEYDSDAESQDGEREHPESAEDDDDDEHPEAHSSEEESEEDNSQDYANEDVPGARVRPAEKAQRQLGGTAGRFGALVLAELEDETGETDEE
ncbi:hypothetical protein C8Q79DRAFT_1114897 [Trametes meyenii]|nr:hypothetical protein C8Q79DRAFT_1114897 [Trametes meyenii]